MVKPIIYENENGPVIGTVNNKIIRQDGKIFRDLEGTGELLPYEDWRLSYEERAADLASRLTIEEIAGLMLYSAHQAIPSIDHMPGSKPPTYGGKPYDESGAEAWYLNDAQKEFLEKDHLRHVLLAQISTGVDAAKWNNEAQAFVESLPHGIPINTSSDPRHGAGQATAEFKSSASSVSIWPEGLGMAATFDPAITRCFGEIAAKEYRAMGISTALSPQVDLGTDPRWMRVGDTFGIDPQLVTDMSRAYCDGMQTTASEKDGWGRDSVIAMAKHWPGGGSGEGGRDAHYPFGKFAVYPGNSQDQHLKPFLEGAFKLDGPTEVAGAVMPYYTVSWNYDDKDHQNVGNSYSHYIINDLLREKYGFDGVVCTDWGLTGDPNPEVDSLSSHCYGVSKLSVAERHLRIIESGVDQFGGNNEAGPIIEAYELGCKKYGEAAMRARMERSAVRLLRGMFRLGLFENPYVNPQESADILACEKFCKEGYDAQLKSVVMLKNKGVLPIGKERKKVYIPGRHIDGTTAFIRIPMPPMDMPGADPDFSSEYFDLVATPKEADMAIVFADSPISDPYSRADRAEGGNGYLPITLQYEPYTATEARDVSIAGGDHRETFTNRSYKNKTNYVSNYQDLENVRKTKEILGDKPLILVLRMKNPCVMAEMEPYADAILVDFGVQLQAIYELITGVAEPSGLLPVQLPKDMASVERHCEDRPHDITPYVDGEGNVYDFGFGLNWKGVIEDDRTRKYCR